MKRKIFFLSVACLLLLVVVSITVLTSNNSSYSLDTVSLEETFSEVKNQFALMIENEDGEYVESSSDSWPTDMILNTTLSGCVNSNAETIEDALVFDTSTNKASVNFNGAFACYLYFSYPMAENLINYADLWNNTSAGDGYRYIGTDPDNYICLGTDTVSECLSNSSKYLYRIIGVFADSDGEYHLKIIKNTALSTSYAWNSIASQTLTTYSAVYWGSNTLSSYLNSTSTSASYYLYNSTYMTSEMRSYIYAWDYPKLDSGYYRLALIDSDSSDCMGSSTTSSVSTIPASCTTSDETDVDTGGSHYLSMTGTTILSKELATTGSTSKYVGLMTPADFALSMGTTCSSKTSSSCASTLKTSWLYLGSEEWTMATDGYYGTRTDESDPYIYTYYYTYITTSGTISYTSGVGTKKVRPVLYLNSDVVKVSGDGSSTSPFLIS